MENRQPKVMRFRELPETVQTWIREEGKRRKALASQISQDSEARKALDRLKHWMPERNLIDHLSEKIELPGRPRDAELRKADKTIAQSLLGSLEKTQRLARAFAITSEPLPEWGLFDGLLRVYCERVRWWTELKGAKPTFDRRNQQQLRFLEEVRKRSGKLHYREVAALLCAAYTAQGIPEDQFPTEGSLSILFHRSAHRQALVRSSI
jgi:hypothetical protein